MEHLLPDYSCLLGKKPAIALEEVGGVGGIIQLTDVAKGRCWGAHALGAGCHRCQEATLSQPEYLDTGQGQKNGLSTSLKLINLSVKVWNNNT